eukprot:gene9057-1154_t
MEQKSLFILLVFILFINTVNAGWQTNTISNRIIASQKGLGFDFSIYASEIKWTVQCSGSADIYLLDLPNLNKLKAGSPFTYFYGLKGTTYSSSSYANQADISNTVIIYAKNPSTTNSITCSYVQQQYLSSSALAGTWAEYLYYSIGFAFSIIFCFCCYICVICACSVFCCGSSSGKRAGYIGGDYYDDGAYIVGGPTVVVGDFGDHHVDYGGGGFGGDTGGDFGDGGNEY